METTQDSRLGRLAIRMVVGAAIFVAGALLYIYANHLVGIVIMVLGAFTMPYMSYLHSRH